VLISAFAWWALGGVVGVGVITALVLWSVGLLQKRTSLSVAAAAWLLVAAGGLLELVAAARWSASPHDIGGALILVGLVAVVRILDLGPGFRPGRVLPVMAVAVVLAAGAVFLPAALWRALYGAGLLASGAWLAATSRTWTPRATFGAGGALLGTTGLVLLVSALRPPWSGAADFIAALSLLLGVTALAAAHVTFCLATETTALRDELSTLEDEHEHLLRLAETDPLSGCPNRQALRAWFDRWEGGEPVSVVLVDVDGLKRINEKHGEDAGDEALKLVAGVLSSSIRPGDLVVRWGGDEFVALLRGAGHEAAQRRFTGLIASLQDRADAFPYDEPLAVQWGVSTCASADDIARALAEADDRMYAMKRRQSSID
jgi:diguanylate cyclase (GGDEF)-like protein